MEKKRLIILIRLVMVIIGVFFLLTSSLDILGIIPYSELSEKPNLVNRIIKNMQFIIGGVVFVYPYKEIRHRIVSYIGGLSLIAFCVLQIYFSIVGVIGYFNGEKSFAIVPFSLIYIIVLALNLIAYYQIVLKRKR